MTRLSAAPLHIRALGLYTVFSFIMSVATTAGLQLAMPSIMKDFELGGEDFVEPDKREALESSKQDLLDLASLVGSRTLPEPDEALVDKMREYYDRCLSMLHMVDS